MNKTLNDVSFILPTDESSDAINQNRFKIISSSGNSVFYYNPASHGFRNMQNSIQMAELRKYSVLVTHQD